MKKTRAKATNSTPTEKQICTQFFIKFSTLQACSYFKKKMLVFHIANEQYNNRNYTMSLQRMGLTAGVADYCILLEGGKVAFIEFKRNAKLKPSENQLWFKERCDALGIPYSLQWTMEGAIEFIGAL